MWRALAVTVTMLVGCGGGEHQAPAGGGQAGASGAAGGALGKAEPRAAPGSGWSGGEQPGRAEPRGARAVRPGSPAPSGRPCASWLRR